ncbi:uncharacterized protein LOC120335258 [Styela clava]
MILNEMSSPSTGATASISRNMEHNGVASPVTKTTNHDVALNNIERKSTPINRNTFVVRLKPAPENGDGNQIPKTNLLQLFKNSDANNVSVVKALGIGKIVVNRTLIKNTKNKMAVPVRRDVKSANNNTTRISVEIPTTTIKLTTSKSPLFIRGRPQKIIKHEKQEIDTEKKDDDIGKNLANFMNFKLSSIVPSPIKQESNHDGSFQFSHENKKINNPSDDDLTSLSWLIENDKSLTKTIRSCNPDDAGISLSGDESGEDDDIGYAENKAVFTAKSKVDCSGQGGFATRQYGQPYSPNGKPPYSFSCLIFMAVEDSPEKKLPVKDIYSWVCKHFPYFRTAPSGWKNSIRHNLSLNKCFKKAETNNNTHDAIKGSLWCIDPAYRPNLIQALKRTPFYPYLYPGGMCQRQPLSLNNLASLLPGVKSGRVPLWSPSMTPSQTSWTDPDVASAALNLMGLKGTDTIDQQSPNVKSTIQELTAEICSRSRDIIGSIPIVITDPADDHTYTTISLARHREEETGDRCTSPDSDKSAPDAAYEFETCGTDFETEDEESGLYGEECDLGDSGFASLRGGKKRKVNDTSSTKNKRKRNSKSTEQESRRQSSKSRSKRSSPKQGLKVRFQTKNKSNKSGNSKKSSKFDDTNSDVDSGKDSPKVEIKSRSRTRKRSLSKESTSEKKNSKKVVRTRTTHSSPYGTRSSTQTRHSKRIAASEQGNALEKASARKRRQDSISINWEDEEEIKLAAGSLLHLAGVRSPQSSCLSNT